MLCGVFNHIWREMLVPLGQSHGKNCASYAVGTVVRLNRSAMKFHYGLAQIQSDSCAVEVHVTRVASLIEALEQLVCVAFLQSDTVVDNFDNHVVIFFSK